MSSWSSNYPPGPATRFLDVGCGTGLCLPLLRHKVGPSGTIVGIDASAQMLEVAGYLAVGHARGRSTPPSNNAEGSDGDQG